MKRVTNPLRVDPSRTATLRRRFAAALRGRLLRLRAAVTRYFADGVTDALSKLDSQHSAGVANALPIGSDAQKIASFRAWLGTQLEADLYGRSQQQLLERYLDQAFRRGVGRAFDQAGRGDQLKDSISGFGLSPRDSFVRRTLAGTTARERLEMLSARAVAGLEGIGDASSAALSRALADGLTRGASPAALASSLGAELDRAASRRLTALANTESMRAFTEGQLTAFTALGLTDLRLLAEWVAFAGACPLCADMDGTRVPISQAWGLLPYHPNCRCVWVAVVVRGAVP